MGNPAKNISAYLIAAPKSTASHTYNADCMPVLIFATNNDNKVKEVGAIVGDKYDVRSLKAAGITIEIPEPFATLEENARGKCHTIYKLTGNDCFSEDTGLEVDALNGAPGVKSARYAGEEKNDQKNINLLLHNLANSNERTARFRTIVALIVDGKEHQFEGICKGIILNYPRGAKGFGYDPVFLPDGATRSFAEMDMEEKNLYSHRQKAITQLMEFLSHHWKKTSRF